MAGAQHVIVMTSFADKRKAFDRLYEVLKQIDSELEEASDVAGRDAIRVYARHCEYQLTFIISITCLLRL